VQCEGLESGHPTTLTGDRQPPPVTGTDAGDGDGDCDGDCDGERSTSVLTGSSPDNGAVIWVRMLIAAVTGSVRAERVNPPAGNRQPPTGG
jgi:hypothetical protein